MEVPLVRGAVTGGGQDGGMAMPVEVIRSRKRRKTVQAELIDGTVRIHMPHWVSKEDEATYVADLVAKLQRRHASHHVDLVERAADLARRYGFPTPASIRWSDHQQKRWGSCTIGSGDIRISRRLADFPTWVLDYVIVHELAHLVEPHHSARFHQLVAAYPKAEMAEGFLLGVGYRPDDDEPVTEDGEPSAPPLVSVSGVEEQELPLPGFRAVPLPADGSRRGRRARRRHPDDDAVERLTLF